MFERQALESQLWPFRQATGRDESEAHEFYGQAAEDCGSCHLGICRLRGTTFGGTLVAKLDSPLQCALHPYSLAFRGHHVSSE
jgi:hypothetical protein